VSWRVEDDGHSLRSLANFCPRMHRCDAGQQPDGKDFGCLNDRLVAHVHGLNKPDPAHRDNCFASAASRPDSDTTRHAAGSGPLPPAKAQIPSNIIVSPCHGNGLSRREEEEKCPFGETRRSGLSSRFPRAPLESLRPGYAPLVCVATGIV
jgi:hypothetical protein